MKIRKLLILLNLIILLSSLSYIVYGQDKNIVSHKKGDFQFEWDFSSDKAKVLNTVGNQTIWSGSLLPSFWVEDSEGEKHYLKAKVDLNTVSTSEKEITFNLQFPDFGKGELVIKKTGYGISFEKLTVQWQKIPKIISMYFGTVLVPEEGKAMRPAESKSFVGNWQAAGYCVPGAKEGPAQSYFRMWDFGSTTIALGNFGPSLGTPYGAAFPRPVLAFAMGNDNGWTLFGTGSVPDAPMLLDIQSTLGCIEYLYREDLWGEGKKTRVWDNPLRMTFANEAWYAFKEHFQSFPIKPGLNEVHQRSLWNTWGNWRNKEYPIRPMVDFSKQLDIDAFIVDDPWEESQGLGRPSKERFPDFFEDFEYIDNNNLDRGIWETLGWISDTAAAGLTKNDLILGKDGNPCKTSWNYNPFAPGYFCIDISSQKSRDFLKERTIWTMQNVKPKLIKLDFGYGLPPPTMGVPRNPEYRGERYCFELMKIIVSAAKSVDPEVTIMYYGINPLFGTLADMVSLDDQGDLWYAVKEGHDQWTMWATLLSDQQVAISGSSGYDWHKDDEVVLNSIMLGAPGAVLATHLDDGSPVPEKYLNRRLALNTCYRKNVEWEPIWLNSHLGDLSEPPALRCWGRLEKFSGKEEMTGLVLNGQKDNTYNEFQPFEWNGRWALVSQTDAGILNTEKLAVVPFDVGFISIQLPKKPSSIEILNINGTKEYTNWEWEGNKLILHISESALNNTAGFLIKTK